jgi:hypothetical protein
MTEPRDIRVFISWSGDLAKDVAMAVRRCIKHVSDRWEPWMSDADIGAGERGLAQIESELQGSGFGIVVVTPENQWSQWVNFEAGALSKVIQADSQQRVVPLLVDFESTGDLEGPLTQFQYKKLDEAGLRAVLKSLIEVSSADEARVWERFEDAWPRFEADLEAAMQAEAERAQGDEEAREQRDTSDLLEEILDHVRALRRPAAVTTIGGGSPPFIMSGTGVPKRGLMLPSLEPAIITNPYDTMRTVLESFPAVRSFTMHSDGATNFSWLVTVEPDTTDDTVEKVRMVASTASGYMPVIVERAEGANEADETE